MTTIRTKFRPSSVPGRKGTVVYRIIHRRMVRNVSSTVSISTEDWERLLKGEEDGSLADIRTEIECGVTLIEDIAGNLERAIYRRGRGKDFQGKREIQRLHPVHPRLRYENERGRAAQHGT